MTRIRHFLASVILLLITIKKSDSVNSEQSINNGIANEILNDTEHIEELINFEKICEKNICVAKCCSKNRYMLRMKCVHYKEILDFSDLPVYDDKIRKTEKTAKDIFNIVPKKDLNVHLDEALDMSQYGFNNYLTEKGILYVEFPNAYRRWTPRNTSTFCVDYQLPIRNMTKPEPRFWVIMDQEPPPQSNYIFISSALLVSSVFLFLVLVVYFLLPELRNLCGMVLMAYVASLLGAFLLLASLQILTLLDQHSVEACRGFTFLIYFFFLASFCWMNVMSFDIWWTFRGYAKARPIHRRGERFKFMMYCLYAWGVPLAMTVALANLNEANLRQIPWFITPKVPSSGCFIEGGERLLYLYVPMLILILSNILFFLMTAYNVWRLNRGTAVLDSAAAGTPAAHRKNRHRLMVYLKLSVIMGVSWVLEVISSLMPQLQVWYITDMYNMLIGVAIFLIFVCKKKILRKLIKKFNGYTQSRWSPHSKSQSSATADSDISQETPLQMSTNPKGSVFNSIQSKR